MKRPPLPRICRPPVPLPTSAWALLPALMLAGCASLKPAQMALPPALATLGAETVQGLGAGRSGSYTVGDESGSFQRGRDRLSLFGALDFDRASTRLQHRSADGRSLQAACVGRQSTLSVGVLTGQPGPYTVQCRWQGGLDAQMTLAAASWVPGSRAERQGAYRQDALTLDVRSVHQVQGSRLPLEAPIGYVFSVDGQAVGAVEINGSTPRLWRPAAGSALREPITQAALALALLWDPAGAQP